MAFDQNTRIRLQKFVGEAKDLLIREFTRQLQNAYGMDPGTGEVSDPGKLTHLDDAGMETAILLRDSRAHYLASSPSTSEKGVLDRIIREQAFTVLNRLCALRMAEAREIIIESISNGYNSKGFQLYFRLAGSALGETAEAYKCYLFSLFDELAADLAVLFDRFSPMGRLFPRDTVLLELLDKINHTDLVHLWSEDETIGWIYQYFNPKEERDAMRKASRSPRDTREMAVRNQFFTPRYVVEFLTDNSLGRIWYEMRKGDTSLTEKCRFLVRRPMEAFLAFDEKGPGVKVAPTDLSQEELLKQPVYIEHRPIKDPRDLRILDPACGSGHFLLYTFDLLELIYEEAWNDPESPNSEISGRTLLEDFETIDDMRREIPKLIIEHNLHGIDIDSRAVQIAVVALWLRAQKTWKNLKIQALARPRIFRSNIVTAEPMPGEEDLRQEFTASLKPRVLGQIVYEIFEKMKLAGEAGALLKIEEEIKEAVAAAKKQWKERPKPEQMELFAGSSPVKPIQMELRFNVEGITDKRFWEQAEERILDALKKFAEIAENGQNIRRRLFAEDAARGFAFIDLCRNRYDAILMNPPFGASSRGSKNYIEDQYPITKGDVLAAFLERALTLTTPQGRIGAISNRTPFFLSSFKRFRTDILGKVGHVRLLADLGEGVLEAMVETAIYIVTKDQFGEPESLFFRLLVDVEKGAVLQKLIQESLKGKISSRIFVIKPRHFERLEGIPYAYWVSRSTIEILGEHPPIEGNKGEIRVGLQTGEDFRHLRLLWEIPNENIVPRLPVKNDPALSIRQQCIHQLRNLGHWVPFSKTDSASPWFSPITLAVNWSHEGHEIKHFTNQKGKLRSRPQNEIYYFSPGFSYMGRCTRLVPYLVPAGVMPTARRAQIFPNHGEEYALLGICASNIGSAVARFSGEKFAWPNFQAGMVQGLPSCSFPDETLILIKEYVDAEVNRRRAVVQGYEPFQEFSIPAWIQPAMGGETTWDLYSLFGRGLENKIAEAFNLDLEQLAELERDIREAISIRASSEDIESEDTVDDSNEKEQELNVELISETPEEKAVGLYMYVVGVALGRWDVRMALNPKLAPKLPSPFDPLPVCPPGMLTGPDGLPAEPNSIVSEEWLQARPDANTLPTEDALKKTIITDLEYPLHISWNGILVDDPGVDKNQLHRDDIIRRVHEAFDLLWKGKAHDIEQQTCDFLGITDLRDYFRKPAKFFQDHLNRYTKCLRQAPIYWPLSTRSGAYTIWLYYHRLNDQILFTCINDFVEPKIKEVTNDADKLRQKSSRNRQEEKQLEELFSLEQELRDFRDELLRIAKFWKPDLNDGAQITAAPLWKLFLHRPWQNKLKDTWKKLEKGDYDWAHLAYSIWPERVIRKSHKDRSLAIAHDLENFLWEEVEDGTDRQGNPKYKWVPKDFTKAELDQFIQEKVMEI